MKHRVKAMGRIAAVGLIFFFTVISFLGGGACLAEIYRWQDDKGQWHFTDSPPSDVDVQTMPSEPEPSNGRTSPPDTAQPQAPAAESGPEAAPSNPARETSGGVFWRISGQGRQPSYLLGTIHSTDPRITRLRPDVSAALNKAERFVMEMILDGNALLQFGGAMMITDGQDLEGLLGTATYEKVVKALADYGLPEPAVRMLKPWVAMAMLSMPKPSDGQILDMVLYQVAASQDKTTAGLETPQEQLAVFEGLSMDEQIALLKMTLDQLPMLPALFEDLTQAWLEDDLQKIAALAGRYQTAQNMQAVKRFMLKLNDERNLRMLERMEPHLRQGHAFIAVGALHLAGPHGLISLLEARGYSLEPIR